MDPKARAVLADVEGVADAMLKAVIAGLKEWTNGPDDTQTVGSHFTAGNQQRYGWQPLSRDYFLAKQKSLKGKVKGGNFQPGGGRKGSRLDKNAEFQSSTGELMGIGTGTNKPMLVASGATREAVTRKTARIVMDGSGIGVIVFAVPDYAVHLHTGTTRMPKRSPVEPNEADVGHILDAVQRNLTRLIGKGGAVAVSGNSVPGKARTD